MAIRRTFKTKAEAERYRKKHNYDLARSYEVVVHGTFYEKISPEEKKRLNELYPLHPKTKPNTKHHSPKKRKTKKNSRNASTKNDWSGWDVKKSFNL